MEQDVEQVFIETTGVASSVQLIKQMMLSREFDDNFLLVKNLLVIDALEESVELLKQEKMLDLTMADLVILHKTDLVDEEKLTDFRSFLQSLPQLVFIETNHGKLDPNELIFDEKSKALTTLLDHLDEISDTSIDHSQDILYQVIYPKKTVEIEELRSSIQEAQANGASIRRAKGTFTLSSGDQISLNGTTNDLKMEGVKTKTKLDNVLVFIGKNVTKQTIKPIVDILC
jgi:G3E family GTPase